jgi:DNA adenine methylase
MVAQDEATRGKSRNLVGMSASYAAVTSQSADLLTPKPLLKWAGGKTQLLSELHRYIPETFNKYIEPFFGGGALFFDLQPSTSVVADVNPELINLYRTVASNPVGLSTYLSEMENTSDFYYQLRSIRWEELDPEHAAARTLFLNRTCFNGLFRVNKKGEFNVPYGKYAKPAIPSLEQLVCVSKVLNKTEIIEGDFRHVLHEFAEPRDLIFLDPPYFPISEFSDFKRYTKEQFHEDSQLALATEVVRLAEMGCFVILTNSNHPLVHEIYGDLDVRVIETRRSINSRGGLRTGQDVIVSNCVARKL